MIDMKFIEIFPDTEDRIVADIFGMTVFNVRYYARKFHLHKSKRFIKILTLRARSIRRMRNEEGWKPEFEELKSLAVCPKNYARIKWLCDLFYKRDRDVKLANEKEAPAAQPVEYTEEDIRTRMDYINEKLLKADFLSDEAKRLMEEFNDLTVKLYALQHKRRRSVHFTQADYSFYTNGLD